MQKLLAQMHERPTDILKRMNQQLNDTDLDQGGRNLIMKQ